MCDYVKFVCLMRRSLGYFPYSHSIYVQEQGCHAGYNVIGMIYIYILVV